MPHLKGMTGAELKAHPRGIWPIRIRDGAGSVIQVPRPISRYAIRPPTGLGVEYQKECWRDLIARPWESCHSMSTVTLRFSPRLALVPASRALANSKAATAELAGPSHISARAGSTLITSRFAFSGPPGHQDLLLLVPELLRARCIATEGGLAGERYIDLLVRINEGQAYLRG